MDHQYIPVLLGMCAALAVIVGIAWTYSLLIRSFCDIYAFRRHEAWKKEIFKAWRR